MYFASFRFLKLVSILFSLSQIDLKLREIKSNNLIHSGQPFPEVNVPVFFFNIKEMLHLFFTLVSY